METDQALEYRREEIEQRIEWVLSHPGMSDWLKHSLRSAQDREPVDVLNDLEFLQNLLGQLSRVRIEQHIRKSCAS